MSYGRQHTSNPSYSLHNQVKLIRGGREYFELLVRMINEASSTVHLQTYIFDEDETGMMVAETLLNAVRRGVHVFLLLDGYASKGISKNFIDKLKKGGIQFRWFQPLLRSRYFYFGRRLHHKIIVTDASTSLVGGMNISNRYNDMPGEPAWLDWAVYSKGEASAELFYLCQETWNKAAWGKKKEKLLDRIPVSKLPENECLVRVRKDDWVSAKSQISRSYKEMLMKASTSITIMSSYFVPGNAFMKSLIAAAKKGVHIRLITAGRSDVPFTKQAERYLYDRLLGNNIELFEYNKGILHGKLSTYDTKWVTVGSFNINNLSAYASIEVNLDILDTGFALEVERKLNKIIAEDCVRIHPSDHMVQNGFFNRLWNRACFKLINAGVNLFTSYYRQHPE